MGLLKKIEDLTYDDIDSIIGKDSSAKSIIDIEYIKENYDPDKEKKETIVYSWEHTEADVMDFDTPDQFISFFQSLKDKGVLQCSVEDDGCVEARVPTEQRMEIPTETYKRLLAEKRTLLDSMLASRKEYKTWLELCEKYGDKI